MQIFQATAAQIDDLAFLLNQYRIFYGQDSNFDAAKNFIQERFKQQDSIIFLATVADKPVGYTQLFLSWSTVSLKRVLILNDLFVLPEVRKQGIARALMNAAQDYAISTQAVRIILATEVTNTTAQSLYELMGYRKFDRFYHYILAIA
jgi:ribosomal protein S18 acetylase RimI-like enzyme